MARRFQTLGICRDRAYTVKTAARIIGVTEATIRNWARNGLRLIKDQRPHIVRGEDLIDFQKKREAANKVPIGKGQFFCMRCKAPRNPSKGSLDYKATSLLTGRLSGTCDACGGKMGQFCSAISVADFISDPAATSSKPPDA
ncbi:MAG: helix-turn-helix domain-containing protein [Pseudomonadota bacterium]